MTGRPCSTCQHPRRATIDRRLSSGEPITHVASEYGLSRVSLGRHRRNCAGLKESPAEFKKAASQGTVALASLPGRDELGAAYEAIRQRADAIALQAEQSGSLAIAISGLREMRTTLDSLSRLAGHHDKAATAINVGVQVNVGEVAAQIIAAISGSTPENKAIMIDQLEALAQ